MERRPGCSGDGSSWNRKSCRPTSAIIRKVPPPPEGRPFNYWDEEFINGGTPGLSISNIRIVRHGRVAGRVGKENVQDLGGKKKQRAVRFWCERLS